MICTLTRLDDFVQVNTVNGAPDLHNPADPVSGYAGIPRNMTTIAQLMQGAGYETHMYGKWDAGMATPEHTPIHFLEPGTYKHLLPSTAPDKEC